MKKLVEEVGISDISDGFIFIFPFSKRLAAARKKLQIEAPELAGDIGSSHYQERRIHDHIWNSGPHPILRAELMEGLRDAATGDANGH